MRRSDVGGGATDILHLMRDYTCCPPLMWISAPFT
jgi:hypothetical protein